MKRPKSDVMYQLMVKLAPLEGNMTCKDDVYFASIYFTEAHITNHEK